MVKRLKITQHIKYSDSISVCVIEKQYKHPSFIHESRRKEVYTIRTMDVVQCDEESFLIQNKFVI